MQNFLKHIQVSIYSIADLNIVHCVELIFFEGKLGRFFCGKGKKSSYELKTILI